jgi:hypothetical protein
MTIDGEAVVCGDDAAMSRASPLWSTASSTPWSGLKMPRANEILDATVRRLERGELEAIDALLGEEFPLRENRRVKTALVMARLSTIKTLAGFEFLLPAFANARSTASCRSSAPCTQRTQAARWWSHWRLGCALHSPNSSQSKIGQAIAYPLHGTHALLSTTTVDADVHRSPSTTCTLLGCSGFLVLTACSN